MKTNQWINASRRLFNLLIRIYPQQHRADYAESMSQVFSDQCREAYHVNGPMGILSLWMRVLPDLGYTAIREHMSVPGAAWGLLEPVPNAPLPWKGILLILLPGLVYLVSQIAQLTGSPWYLTVYYRAAFVLIIPVIMVWAVTRRFPLWGLIPVGLLFRLVKEIGYQFITLHPGVFSTNPFLNTILSMARLVESNLFIPSALFLIASLILAIRYFRKNTSNRNAKVWLGIFLLTMLARVFFDFFAYIFTVPFLLVAEKVQSPVSDWMNASILERIPLALDMYEQAGLMDMLIANAQYLLYNASALILLIFVGTLFTKRHGFFTIFILVGYFLPAILVGLPTEVQNDPAQLLLISLAVILYRSLLSLVAPIWMSRTRMVKGKRRVILVCIAVSLVVHFAMQFYPMYAQYPESFRIDLWQISILLDELLLIAGFLLGIVLYQGTSQEPDTPEMVKESRLKLSLENS